MDVPLGLGAFVYNECAFDDTTFESIGRSERAWGGAEYNKSKTCDAR